MDKEVKIILLALAYGALMLFIGVGIGEQVERDSSRSLINDLSIELTKLEIKKLKGLCNDK